MTLPGQPSDFGRLGLILSAHHAVLPPKRQRNVQYRARVNRSNTVTPNKSYFPPVYDWVGEEGGWTFAPQTGLIEAYEQPEGIPEGVISTGGGERRGTVGYAGESESNPLWADPGRPRDVGYWAGAMPAVYTPDAGVRFFYSADKLDPTLTAWVDATLLSDEEMPRKEFDTEGRISNGQLGLVRSINGRPMRGGEPGVIVSGTRGDDIESLFFPIGLLVADHKGESAGFDTDGLGSNRFHPKATNVGGSSSTYVHDAFGKGNVDWERKAELNSLLYVHKYAAPTGAPSEYELALNGIGQATATSPAPWYARNAGGLPVHCYVTEGSTASQSVHFETPDEGSGSTSTTGMSPAQQNLVESLERFMRERGFDNYGPLFEIDQSVADTWAERADPAMKPGITRLMWTHGGFVHPGAAVKDPNAAEGTSAFFGPTRVYESADGLITTGASIWTSANFYESANRWGPIEFSALRYPFERIYSWTLPDVTSRSEAFYGGEANGSFTRIGLDLDAGFYGAPGGVGGDGVFARANRVNGWAWTTAAQPVYLSFDALAGYVGGSRTTSALGPPQSGQWRMWTPSPIWAPVVREILWEQEGVIVPGGGGGEEEEPKGGGKGKGGGGQGGGNGNGNGSGGPTGSGSGAEDEEEDGDLFDWLAKALADLIEAIKNGEGADDDTSADPLEPKAGDGMRPARIPNELQVKSLEIEASRRSGVQPYDDRYGPMGPPEPPPWDPVLGPNGGGLGPVLGPTPRNPEPAAGTIVGYTPINAAGYREFQSPPYRMSNQADPERSYFGYGTPSRGSLLVAPTGYLPDGPYDQSAWLPETVELGLWDGHGAPTTVGDAGEVEGDITRSAPLVWGHYDYAAGKIVGGPALYAAGTFDSADLEVEFRDEDGVDRDPSTDPGSLAPSQSGHQLGTSGARWKLYATDIDMGGGQITGLAQDGSVTVTTDGPVSIALPAGLHSPALLTITDNSPGVSDTDIDEITGGATGQVIHIRRAAGSSSGLPTNLISGGNIQATGGSMKLETYAVTSLIYDGSEWLPSV